MTAPMNTYRKFIPLLLAGGLVGAATATWAGPKASKPPVTEAPTLNLVVDDTPVSRDGRLQGTYSPVLKKVVPSVVRVNVKQKAKFASAQMPEIPPQFRHFFGPGMPGMPGMPGEGDGPQRMPRAQGLGSGVIVTADGYILTNNHVVEGAEEVKVALQDGREFDAKVVGLDPKTDVAVLKVDAGDLPALPVGDSEHLEVGDVVLAIGNPFGIGQTVTMGIVSATGRATMGLDYEDFIQTDAAINPGNSGGALVDASGRLVGINTAILSRSGGNQGIGFAIPVSLARDVMESLVKDGRVTRGYFGVMIQDVNPALAKKFGLDEPRGALVGDVTPEGPAAEAGLESGDVVTTLNGKEIRDSRHLKLSVAKIHPGESATVKVLRGGKVKTLKVQVGELPGEPAVAKATPAEDEGTLNGVGVMDLDARSRKQFNVPSGVEGAIISEVAPDSAAAEAGLQAGDVILEINRTGVKDAGDAVRLTESPEEKTTLLKIWSRGGTRYLVVDESKSSSAKDKKS
ncbi:MAG: DegQ family serine endoprotease [Verrucomicrobia bacterium]|nr:DegQ family serine endoprotease [Verrucomicrobiota bacterium]